MVSFASLGFLFRFLPILLFIYFLCLRGAGFHFSPCGGYPGELWFCQEHGEAGGRLFPPRMAEKKAEEPDGMGGVP